LDVRILFTGVTSIHGWPVFKAFLDTYKSTSIFGIRSPKMRIPAYSNVQSCCITDKDALYTIKKTFNPTHIIHCAGVCDLDVCEQRPAWARAMNTLGSQVIADVFGESSRILYLSSDLVFSGINNPGTGYTEEDNVDPLSVAGKTIAAAEEEIQKCPNHMVLRLGLPIGKSITGDKGAIDFIDKRLKRHLPITLFHDEWRSVIHCETIAAVVKELFASDIFGLLHLGGPQKLSLFEIGEWVLKTNNYRSEYLKGIMRSEEISGPPRMGDVSLNSTKAQKILSFSLDCPLNW
jgi:dTDP-4-dehydrorhamnose reductase